MPEDDKDKTHTTHKLTLLYLFYMFDVNAFFVSFVTNFMAEQGLYMYAEWPMAFRFTPISHNT